MNKTRKFGIIIVILLILVAIVSVYTQDTTDSFDNESVVVLTNNSAVNVTETPVLPVSITDDNKIVNESYNVTE